MIITIKPSRNDFQVKIDDFFASLGWVYLCHRYAPETQGLLLRLLTLSGLDPVEWARCATQLVTCSESVLGKTLVRADVEAEVEWLLEAFAEIQQWAQQSDVALGEPPLMPSYLAAYGYTHERYKNDLVHLYGPLQTKHYRATWPLAASPLQQAADQPKFFQQAVAIMGATAGAIERLVAMGGGDGKNK